MSQERVERFRQAFGAWQLGDLRTAEALLRDFVAPDFELHPLYLDKVYKGANALDQWTADVNEMWEDYRLELDELIDLDAHILFLGRVRGRGAASGVPVDQPIVTLFSFRGDTLVRGEAFASKQEALEAVGQPE